MIVIFNAYGRHEYACAKYVDIERMLRGITKGVLYDIALIAKMRIKEVNDYLNGRKIENK
jgi:hypothetical protein